MSEEKECVCCKLYKGDCGKHHIDADGHIHYDIPSEAMYNGAFLTCFKPSDKYLTGIVERQAEDLSTYPVDVIKRALEIAISRSKE